MIRNEQLAHQSLKQAIRKIMQQQTLIVKMLENIKAAKPQIERSEIWKPDVTKSVLDSVSKHVQRRKHPRPSVSLPKTEGQCLMNIKSWSPERAAVMHRSRNSQLPPSSVTQQPGLDPRLLFDPEMTLEQAKHLKNLRGLYKHLRPPEHKRSVPSMPLLEVRSKTKILIRFQDNDGRFKPSPWEEDYF